MNARQEKIRENLSVSRAYSADGDALIDRFQELIFDAKNLPDPAERVRLLAALSAQISAELARQIG